MESNSAISFDDNQNLKQKKRSKQQANGKNGEQQFFKSKTKVHFDSDKIAPAEELKALKVKAKKKKLKKGLKTQIIEVTAPIEI